MIILGIDPGSSGGIAIIENKINALPKIIFASKMSVITLFGKKVVDVQKVSSYLKQYNIDVSIIEKVHAMPRQGVTSSFQFGRSFGGIEALCYLYTKRVDYVAPVIWKKNLGLGASKQDSLDLARLKFGNLEYWNLKSNDGIAEAALLALFWINKHT